MPDRRRRGRDFELGVGGELERLPAPQLQLPLPQDPRDRRERDPRCLAGRLADQCVPAGDRGERVQVMVSLAEAGQEWLRTGRPMSTSVTSCTSRAASSRRAAANSACSRLDGLSRRRRFAPLGEIVEHTLVQPTFVCDYPAVAQPLARPHRDDPRLIEAWDLIVDGVQRATGFSELIDPVIQRERLTEQSFAAAAPPMGGMGMGIDRLLMLFAGAGIRETILFPLLRPQG